MIICNINDFDFSHKIYHVQEGQENELMAMAPLASLAEVINVCCDTKKDDLVILTGSQVFSENVKQEVYEYALKKYNNTNLKVEVQV